MIVGHCHFAFISVVNASISLPYLLMLGTKLFLTKKEKSRERKKGGGKEEVLEEESDGMVLLFRMIVMLVKPIRLWTAKTFG